MVSGTIPGNSQRGLLVLPIPRGCGLKVLETWYSIPGENMEVLEALFAQERWVQMWSKTITAARGDDSSHTQLLGASTRRALTSTVVAWG